MSISRHISMRRIHGRRNEHGNFTLFALIVGGIVLMLGLFAFDVTNAREDYNQLQAATDAAALASATYLSDPRNASAAGAASIAQQIALNYFQKNAVAACSLSQATLSPSVNTDKPAAGLSEFYLTVNPDNSVVCNSVFGLQPPFLNVLGTYPLRCTSKAGYVANKLSGDVAVLVDLSDSMNFGASPSGSVGYIRQFKTSTGVMSYKTSPPGYSVHPFLQANVTTNRAIPNPDIVAYSAPGGSPPPAPSTSAPQTAIDSNTPLMKAAMDAFANVPAPTPPAVPPTDPSTGQPLTIDGVKKALLIEAKRGDLENTTIYASSNANKSVLQYIPGFTPQVGYQREYQRIALTLSQARSGEIQALHDFIDKVEAGDGSGKPSGVHWSVIGFGHDAPGVKRGKASVQDPADMGKFQTPEIGLASDQGNAQSVKDNIDYGTLSGGTDTPDAIQEGIDQLTGGQSRVGLPKTILLLTDGIPTVGGSYKKAQAATQKGIRILTIGFFEGGYAYPGGPKFCKNIALKAGNGSKSFTVGKRSTVLPLSQQIVNADAAAIQELLLTASGGGGIQLQ